MVFDFTKQIALEAKHQKIYLRLRTFLYLGAIFSTLYLSFLVLFSKAYFTFSFPNPASLKNTVTSPKISDASFPERGRISQNEKLNFFTALAGNYSTVKISFDLNKKSAGINSGKISLQKSFQAFFYPEGDFKGLPVSDSLVYKINGNYYLLEENNLRKFISEKAYLTNYAPGQAVEKNPDFLKNYKIADEMLGFSDGTLLSYGISAYIVSSGKILPIDEVATFSAMGYSWKDVLPASGDEISLYKKEKLFTIASPHPSGTVFKTDENGEYYLIRDFKKYKLPPEVIARYLLGKSPVLVSPKSLGISSECQLKKESLSLRSYSCKIPLEIFKNLSGKDYKFDFASDQEIQIDNLDVIFEKNASFENLKLAILEIIAKIKTNYAPQNQ